MMKKAEAEKLAKAIIENGKKYNLPMGKNPKKKGKK